jgi:hypothetical protein
MIMILNHGTDPVLLVTTELHINMCLTPTHGFHHIVCLPLFYRLIIHLCLPIAFLEQ